jgi:hypothetical protein
MRIDLHHEDDHDNTLWCIEMSMCEYALGSCDAQASLLILKGLKPLGSLGPSFPR